MVGQPVLRLIPSDRKDEERIILERLRRGERVEHFETLRVRKDGRIIDVSLTISPVRDAAGNIVGASKIARDITGQKESVRKLAEAHEQLQRADRMKGEFISTLSHELRTPLNAIVGWLQIMKDGATPDEIAHGVEVIERNVRAQTQLIDDLLDMSRIESGKVTLDIQRVDIPTIISAAMESIKPAAEAKGLRLTSAFSSFEGGLRADKNRLQQVVWNLLTNAVKFTEKGGRIHVTTQKVNSHVEIAVADSGIGIAPEFLDHVFERFHQADSSTTRKHGGLGLGLSIAKHLVELHGGSIVARSEGPGRGAAFIVSLPLMPLHVGVEPGTDGPARDGSRSKPSAQLSGIKILVVDDEPDSAEIVARILERNGAQVRAANSSEAAVRVFTAFAPDVIVSDIGMPEHDGTNLSNACARFRKVAVLPPLRSPRSPGVRIAPAPCKRDSRCIFQSPSKGSSWLRQYGTWRRFEKGARADSPVLPYGVPQDSEFAESRTLYATFPARLGQTSRQVTRHDFHFPDARGRSDARCAAQERMHTD
jgi:signal transduction histidine kinase